MDQTLKVQGMHCDSCKMLIKMEIEDLGLAEKIESIELGDHHMGEVKLTDVNEEEVAKVTEAINSLENYKVAE